MSVDALAETVSERNTRKVGADALQAESASERVERLRIALYHVHLPKLAAADLVAFDEKTQRISPTERTLASVDFLDGLQ
nr:hypothetical protein [Haloprofundus salinisoli]